jgi:DNA primase
MEISELKSSLDIFEVAARLGIRINKYHKALCPFHDDKRPSLQFDKEKQICTCFSGKCEAGTMDVINLVERYEKLSTHEAILWLQKEFLGVNGADKVKASPKTMPTNTAYAEAPAVKFLKLFKVFESNLKRSEKAKAHLEERGLDPEKLEAGYNGTAWQSMKNCIIFPLKDRAGNIVSFYGRSVLGHEKSRHYYNSNRKGLYPGYPKQETEVLILTESVIDNATLQQYTNYEALALYGTNGLTVEHQQAIKDLYHLKEIILFLDGDGAGKEAIKHNGEILQNLKPPKGSGQAGIKLTYVETPEGEDINSLAINHPGEEKELFDYLIKNRKPFLFSSEVESLDTQSKPKASKQKLNTSNPELLFYQNCVMNFTVLGGIKITGLDRLRVTLKIEHQERSHLLPIRHNLDLYNNGQTEQLSQKVAEQMETTTQEATTAIAQLTNELEQYRERRLEAMKPKKETRPVLNHLEKTEALDILKSPKLMEHTMKLITQSGIVGEERNAFIAYLVYTSRKRENPLHLMCLGASGTGKTYLQEKVGELMPEEEKLEITTLSENAFYYFGKEELKNKLILIEDLDGAEAVLYPLRELQSKRRISKTVTLKDNKGNLKTVTLKVEGPVCVSGCTTMEKVYEDNANRCILIYIDTGTDQDKKIMAYQQGVSSGTIDKAKELQARQRLQNMQRMLKPIEIRNPYASMIQLPESVFKPRRTMILLLSFIETITYYHQYHRETKHDSQGNPYIETTAEDIEWSFRLMKEALFSKSDELSGACRTFLEQLKKEVKSGESFTGKIIRKSMRIAPSTLRRYLFELNRYGYLKVVGGSKYKGLEYQIIDYKEYDQLRSGIDEQLSAIMEKIRQRSSVAQ